MCLMAWARSGLLRDSCSINEGSVPTVVVEFVDCVWNYEVINNNCSMKVGG
jgi:hypothetical protein